MKRHIIAIALLFSVFVFAAKVNAQSKGLPQATFPTYARQAGTTGDDLPYSGGLHLSPGLEHTKNNNSQIYNPGEPSQNMKLARWDKGRMPLLIWISPGLKLPECPFESIPDTRVDLVSSLLKESNSLANLSQAPGWTPDINMMVAAGFEQWRQLENEGVISFGFVEDPHKANVLVFFTDRFVGADGPGGTSVHGITCARLYRTNDIRQAIAQGAILPNTPVVMELAIESDLTKLSANAAHEFGHALGIKAHSPYRDDLMYENRIVEFLSPADKATLKYLYQQNPDFLM